MKRVVFEIAKAIKEAGFHEITTHFYSDTYDDEDNPTHQFELCGASIPSYVQDWNDTNKHPEYNEDHINYWSNVWSAPTYMETWLWLWREKNIQIDVVSTFETTCFIVIWKSGERIFAQCKNIDPEEAIEKAIKYLVGNKLLK